MGLFPLPISFLFVNKVLIMPSPRLTRRPSFVQPLIFSYFSLWGSNLIAREHAKLHLVLASDGSLFVPNTVNAVIRYRFSLQSLQKCTTYYNNSNISQNSVRDDGSLGTYMGHLPCHLHVPYDSNFRPFHQTILLNYNRKKTSEIFNTGYSDQKSPSSPFSGTGEEKGFFTLHEPHMVEKIIKKSRFLAFAARCDSIEEALYFIKETSHQGASHNCWAYKIGSQYRFNDDGEPSGTAGKPIYAALDTSGLDNVVVVVIRYYGGIKLGASGLVRAYGGAVVDCLAQAQRVFVMEKKRAKIAFTFDTMGAVFKTVEKYNQIDTVYESNGGFVSIEIPSHEVQHVADQVQQATRGSSTLTVLED